ncbi:DUF952 domain-containing protein [Anaeromicropila herbilytica]|uniref:DUF952 domain-containing protein n=1 Tax=Anaeromicropila herbilytica TaxID=2785025 RepID=A0A7R7ICQ5_9FIRM|nr:DUF952 domain-containing protein [Anaeromicropila herbilytica]BCN30772.1 hypothetical protein bsdtb5_20670 [Anaeromicropila herbilytica]
MIILNCMEKARWEKVREEITFGKTEIQKEGFIHCSPIKYWWRVAPYFQSVEEELVLLCIDTEKLTSPVKWEDGDNSGREYPHIYGEINVDSIIQVLPFNKDKDGNYIKNIEFKEYKNE